MKYYSQIGQDKWVLDYFGTDYKGFFMEIGANDGVLFSNTFTLENLGWNGVCVDACVDYKETLPKNRPNSKCFYAAITDYDGNCSFHNNGLFGKIIYNLGETPCFTMKKLLEITDSPNIIDYLSIDVEGHELNVLQGFPFDTHKFKLLSIEHNAYAYGPHLKNRIFDFLSPLGYVRVFEIGNNGEVGMVNGQEDWYMHKDFVK